MTLCLAVWLLAACTSLLPKSRETTASPWQTYREAQRTFGLIIPGITTAAGLRELQLDPETVPNIAILNYSDVLRRFMANQSVTISGWPEAKPSRPSAVDRQQADRGLVVSRPRTRP